MKDNKVERVRQEVAMFRRQFLQDDTGTFDQALGNQEITAVVSELVAPHRERIYPPLDTLRLFVGQVLSADRACQDVAAVCLSERIAQGQSMNALNTGSYCDARKRLPVTLPVTLWWTRRLQFIHGLQPGALGDVEGGICCHGC